MRLRTGVLSATERFSSLSRGRLSAAACAPTGVRADTTSRRGRRRLRRTRPAHCSEDGRPVGPSSRRSHGRRIRKSQTTPAIDSVLIIATDVECRAHKGRVIRRSRQKLVANSAYSDAARSTPAALCTVGCPNERGLGRRFGT